MNSTPSTNGNEQATEHSSVRAELLLGLIIIDFTFGTVITVGNASLFITICRDPCRCLRTPSVFLIANLSVADFFMGIVSYLRATELTYKYCGLGDLPVLNMSQYFIGAVSILVAVSTLLAMSYDRYIAIIKPFEYPQKITITKAKIAIAMIWLNALVLSILPISDVKKENFLLAYCYSHFVIPSFILTAVYVRIYKMAALQRQELKDVRANLTAANRRLYLEREKRMVVTSLLILFIFYFSFLPYFINIQILYFCSCRTSYAYKVYHYVANEFLAMSSLIDPIMYSWRLPKFNRSLRLCFRRWGRRNVVAVWNGTSSNLKTESLKIAE
ncbi:trace amine-associated receptor 6-like [Oculina patagonica]